MNTTDYEKNLTIAADLYLSKKQIPEKVLLGLVPKDYLEFELYYGTTYPGHRLGKTNFFYATARMIFEQVTSEKNDIFYLPSLKLISFADGEFAGEFIEYLESLIEMDKTKFCNSIKGKDYVKYNPIKYYSQLNKCREIGYINDSDGYTNLRSGPSAKSEIITIIKKGQEFYYDADDISNWWKVEFNQFNGYMHKSRIIRLNEMEKRIKTFYQDYYNTDLSNVEDREVYNKKLFLLIQDYPLAFLEAFCDQKNKVKDYLIKQLKTPIHDSIDLELIYSRLIKVESSCTDSAEIKNALIVAARKTGLVLKRGK